MMKVLIRGFQLMKKRWWLYMLAIVTMAILKAQLDVTISMLINNLYYCIGNDSISSVPRYVCESVIQGVVFITIWRYFTVVYNNEAKLATAKLQKLVYKKSLRLPYDYYEKESHGTFLIRLSYSIEKAADVYGSRFRRVVTPFLSVVVYLIAMFQLNWRMTIILLVTDIVLLMLNLLLNEPMKNVSTKILNVKNEETNTFLDMIQGIEIVKLYELEDILKSKYCNIVQSWRKVQRKRNLLLAGLESVNSGFDLLCSVLFLGIGIIMMNNGSVLLGELVSIYVLYTSFNFHFLQIGKYIPELTECLVYMKELLDFLEIEEERVIEKEKQEQEISIDSKVAAVSFRNVSFGYTEGQSLFENMSIDIESKKITAVVGRTGCGKSTLMKLLLGLYELRSGDIFIFGKNIKQLGYEEARNLISYVPQEPFLYNVSIAENISYGKIGASMDDIIEAAKAANAHEFIIRQEHGYEEVVSEAGKNFSGGECQRIAIARAMLKDAPIILMDEATSALDNESEKSINEFLNYNAKNKTIIIIAHRLTTIEKASAKISL